MKKIGVVLFSIACCFFFFSKGHAMLPKNNLVPSDYNIGIGYEKAAAIKKPIFAVFYTDWCTYCLRFMPKVKTLSNIYKDRYSFVMINVEDESNSPLVNKYKVGGYPTVYIIDKEIDNLVHISAANFASLKDVRTELDRYLKIKSMIKK